jgi:hypothetical protein
MIEFDNVIACADPIVDGHLRAPLAEGFDNLRGLRPSPSGRFSPEPPAPRPSRRPTPIGSTTNYYP